MRRRIFIATLLLVFGAGIAWGVAVLPAYFVGSHQRDVTRTLAEWKAEYSGISSHGDAVRTAEMLEYVQGYYVVGEGYRSRPHVEDALKVQRQETVDSFVTALQAYTNQDFGTDSAKWLDYLNRVESRSRQDSAK